MKLIQGIYAVLALPCISVFGMEEDNNNNNLLDDSSTVPNASYVTVHDHREGKNWIGKRAWRNCWHYRVQKAKIKANNCPEFGNQNLAEQLIAVFYDRNDHQVGEYHFHGKKPTNSDKKRMAEIVRKRLDPNAKPMAVYAYPISFATAWAIHFFDENHRELLKFGMLDDVKFPLTEDIKRDVSEYIDITRLEYGGDYLAKRSEEKERNKQEAKK